jgi:hypothetical protein
MRKLLCTCLVFASILGCGFSLENSNELAPASEEVSICESDGESLDNSQLGVWDGFRGIPWGTNIENLSDMTLVPGYISGSGVFHIKSYRRKEDLLRIGDAELESLTYVFYKDQFYRVSIVVKGVSNQQNLLRALTARYGDRDMYSSPSSEDRWVWLKKGVYIELRSRHGFSTSFCDIFYDRIRRQQRADDQQRKCKEVEDYF